MWSELQKKMSCRRASSFCGSPLGLPVRNERKRDARTSLIRPREMRTALSMTASFSSASRRRRGAQQRVGAERLDLRRAAKKARWSSARPASRSAITVGSDVSRPSTLVTPPPMVVGGASTGGGGGLGGGGGGANATDARDARDARAAAALPSLAAAAAVTADDARAPLVLGGATSISPGGATKLTRAAAEAANEARPDAAAVVSFDEMRLSASFAGAARCLGGRRRGTLLAAPCQIACMLERSSSTRKLPRALLIGDGKCMSPGGDDGGDGGDGGASAVMSRRVRCRPGAERFASEHSAELRELSADMATLTFSGMPFGRPGRAATRRSGTALPPHSDDI